MPARIEWPQDRSVFEKSRFLEQGFDAVRFPLWTGSQRVRFRIAGEDFLLWIPGRLPAQLHRNPRDFTGARRAVRLFNVGGGGCSALNTFEPVPVMVIAPVQVDSAWANLLFEDLRFARGETQALLGFGRIGFPTATADENPTLIAFEPHPVREIIVDHHGHSVGVFHFDVVGAVHIPQTALGKFPFALHLDGAGKFRIHAPMGDVQVMRSPARDHSEAIGFDP